VGQTKDMPDSQEAGAAFILRAGSNQGTVLCPPGRAAGNARDLVEAALARIEAKARCCAGILRRGGQEWCNPRAGGIHRLTLGRLRREIERSTTVDFLRFLSRWQHVAKGAQLHGVDGLLQVIRQLQGYEISARLGERDSARRIARYAPELLDQLCLSGE